MKTNVEGDASTKGDGWAALDEVERWTKEYFDLVLACEKSLTICGYEAGEIDQNLVGKESRYQWFFGS